MHKVGRFDPADLSPHPIFEDHAKGLNWAPFIEHADETVHAAYGVMELTAGGETELTTHAYEKALFVTEGEFEIFREDCAYKMREGDYMLVPTGVLNALRNTSSGAARWVEMSAPQPKPKGGWQDTWFTGPADWSQPAIEMDFQDPRTKMMGHYHPSQQHPPAPQGSADFYGFSFRRLVNHEMGANHFNMFIVGFPDGGLCNHHDHPFEEAYLILEGSVDVTYDGKDYTLETGDFGWTGVGSQHAFFPREGQPVRWLEIQAPQPPAQGVLRWMSQWQYMNTVLKF